MKPIHIGGMSAVRAMENFKAALRKAFAAHHGGYFVYRSEMQSRRPSTLSLHRVGDELHLRIQHDGDGPRYAVAVLPPDEAEALAEALTQPPAAGSAVTS